MMRGNSSANNVGVKSSKKKRECHKVAESKRRNTLKDNLKILQNSIPSVNGKKVTTRAQILRNTTEYIKLMKIKNNGHQQEINDIKRQNSLLEYQIQQLETAKATGDNDVQYSNNSALCVSESDNSHKSDEELQES